MISQEENEIPTSVKHFSINNVHAKFTSSNSKKFLGNNQFFCKSLAGKLELSPQIKKATFYCMTLRQTEEFLVL